LKDALHVMKRWKGKVKLIAGGPNVIPVRRARVFEANVLVNVSRSEGLSHISGGYREGRLLKMEFICENGLC